MLGWMMKEFLASGSRTKLFKEKAMLYVTLEFQKPEPKRVVGLSIYLEYGMVEQQEIQVFFNTEISSV